jgi:hypothetical protein
MSGLPPPSPGQPPDQPVYPRQELLPQQVKPGRSRAPFVVGLAAVLALAVGGVVVWLVLRDDGEETRAAYCQELRDLTNDGELLSNDGPDLDALSDRLERLHEVAPSAVSDDWETLRDAVESAGSTADLDALLQAVDALRVIADDAEDNCDLQVNVPGF